MPYVDNGQVRIAYRSYGEGEPVVLVHGWSCEGRYWHEFGYVKELSDDFRVIILDLRGHGESGTPEDRNFSDAAFASDVLAVLDAQNIDSAHVFGYSLGGWIVFELVAASPARVMSAVIGGAHPYAEDLSDLRTFAPSAIIDAWNAVQAPLSDASKKRIGELDQNVLIHIAKDRIDLSDRLRAVKTPMLAICGTEDWRYEGMERFGGEHERCDFVRVDGTDHLQTWLRSDLLLPSLREFLRR